MNRQSQKSRILKYLIERDDKYISDLEAEVIAFLGEVSDLETKLKEIK